MVQVSGAMSKFWIAVISTLTMSVSGQLIGWKPLREGISGEVLAMVSVGSNVYVGGGFGEAGGVNASNVAMWDGVEWHNLAQGVNGAVFSLELVGSNLYVGGSFSEAGGVSASNVAMWDGSKWYALGEGVSVSDNSSDTVVYAILSVESDVYVGGFFSKAGGVNASNVAMWDGSKWHALGEGVASYDMVLAMVSVGSNVFVGGGFGEAGGVNASNVAMWDGSEWHTLGEGVSGDGPNIGVHAMVSVGSDLYVGGQFSEAGGVSASNVAMWDGLEWHALGEGIIGDGVYSLAPVGSDLFVGGVFSEAGGVSSNNVAMWDGSEWHALGEDVSGDGPSIGVSAMVSVGSDLYVGGIFSEAGGVKANNVATVINLWVTLGQGVGCYNPFYSLEVDALVTLGSDLFVGGYFAEAGGVNASNVAMWDGSEWYALGEGVGDGYFTGVSAMVSLGSDLYVGGQFNVSGGVSVGNVAMWDGLEWHALGEGVSGDGPNIGVQAMVSVGSDLYVGGQFSEAGGVSASNVAVWDGMKWHALGQGVNGNDYSSGVYSLASVGSDLYVGGDFSEAGGVSASNVAMWDGSEWHTLGQGVNDDGVYAMVSVGSDLYVGGYFNEAGGLSANSIASIKNMIVPKDIASSLVSNSHQIPSSTQLDSRFALALIIGLGAFIAAALIGLSKVSQNIAQKLEMVDFFSLDHYTPKGQSPVSTTTAFGGSMSVAMVVVILGIAINTGISYLDRDVISSSGLHPQSKLQNIETKTNGTLEAAFVFRSPWTESCPQPSFEAPTPWTIESVPLPASTSQVPNTTDCAFVAKCIECSIDSATSISVTVPYWFTTGSWASSAKGAAIRKGNESYSVLSGVWNPPSPAEFAKEVSVRIAITKDIQTLGSKAAGGYVTTFDSQSQTDVSFGSTTTISITYTPSGLVFLTSFEQGTTAAGEAWSVIVGGAAGMVQIFRILVPLFEWIWLRLCTRRKSRPNSPKSTPPSESIQDLELSESTHSLHTHLLSPQN